MGFLDYLDKLPEFDQKVESIKRKIVEKKSVPETTKSKVLAINVEVRSIEGAQMVIEKLQEFISKLEENNTTNRKPFRIKPKKVVNGNYQNDPKNVVESTNRACNILDGLSDNDGYSGPQMMMTNLEPPLMMPMDDLTQLETFQMPNENDSDINMVEMNIPNPNQYTQVKPQNRQVTGHASALL